MEHRAATLSQNGHPLDKIELLVLGGTWSSYPLEYQQEFVRDLFFAANTFYQRGDKRARLPLADEQRENEAAAVKIIGLTLETRPDTITLRELRRLRRYGCTRVQLGLQHTDDAVLRRINRGCTTADAKRALRLLKDAGYKVDVHLMPNLPASTPAIDRAMFNQMLDDEDLHADQWKLYPCEIVPWTIIHDWHKQGKYWPYPEEELVEVLAQVKARVHPWIRINRVRRDIPMQYVLGGPAIPNLRHDVVAVMAKNGTRCRCIRCREVGDRLPALLKAGGAVELRERRYRASGGVEIFLSFEATTPENPSQHDGTSLCCGFLRLRLPKRAAAEPEPEPEPEPPEGDRTGAPRRHTEITEVFPELHGAALVRELHVYGQVQATKEALAAGGGGDKADGAGVAQSRGFGRRLLDRAEEIATAEGWFKVAIISGVGARGYYRKRGYELQGVGGYMVKQLSAACTRGVLASSAEAEAGDRERAFDWCWRAVSLAAAACAVVVASRQMNR